MTDNLEEKKPAPQKKKAAKIKLPTKTSMNLNIKVKDANSLSVVLPVALILIVVILAFTKIGVIDRLTALAKARAEVESMQEELEMMQLQLADYDEVYEKYRRYTDHYMTDAELALVNRLDILSLLDRTTNGVGYLESVTISGNSAVIKLAAPALEDFAKIRRSLEESGETSSVAVYTAARNGKAEEDTLVSGSVVVEVIKKAEEAQE